MQNLDLRIIFFRRCMIDTGSVYYAVRIGGGAVGICRHSSLPTMRTIHKGCETGCQACGIDHETGRMYQEKEPVRLINGLVFVGSLLLRCPQGPCSKASGLAITAG
jgi:hypothetical protein